MPIGQKLWGNWLVAAARRKRKAWKIYKTELPRTTWSRPNSGRNLQLLSKIDLRRAQVDDFPTCDATCTFAPPHTFAPPSTFALSTLVTLPTCLAHAILWPILHFRTSTPPPASVYVAACMHVCRYIQIHKQRDEAQVIWYKFYKAQETKRKRQGERDNAKETKHKRQSTKYKVHETKHKEQSTRDKAQETRYTRQSTGDKA